MIVKRKIERVALKDLNTNLFVRQSLNQDHVLFLAELIEHGSQLPPIEITPDRVVIDGRHRIEAHELNNRKEIDAVIVDVADETELITKAYQSNIGGSLPPTPQDTEHTIMLLLEHGESKKRIGELLGLPTGMARRYVNEVQSKISRQKLSRAADAITDGGLTLNKAAEQYGVDSSQLKEVLTGRKRKHKQGIMEMKGALTKTYRSVSSKNARLLRSTLDKFEDGDMTEKQVLTIFAHVENLQKQSSRAVADWKKRFHAKTGKGKKKEE